MIESTDGGVIITVRVIPRARKSGIAGMRADALLVRLQSPPVNDVANLELVDVLATALHVPKRAVVILRGARSRTKRVRVLGPDLIAAQKRLKESTLSVP